MPADKQLAGFAPIARHDARVLILGSFPGVASLQHSEYYAHPQNAFWRIMGEVVGAHRELPYAARCMALSNSGIAIWDVLHACRRDGSLDSAIEAGSERSNDLPAFLAAHPSIHHVLLNGGKAAQAWNAHISPKLTQLMRPITAMAMPSTSPANARMPYARKLALWREAIQSATASSTPTALASKP